MRVFAAISILCTAIALPLSFLCLFAGWKKGFLENVEIMTLDMTKMQQNASSSSANITSVSFEDGGNVTGGGSASVGSHDWYTIHVMDYCEGNTESDGSKKLTGCSKGMAVFNFDPIKVMESDSTGPLGISFNGEITNISGKLKDAYMATFILLCIGISGTGLDFLLSILVFLMDTRRLTHGKAISMINLILALTGFLGLGLASGVITGVTIVAVKKINKYGSDIGLEATKGNKFLGMTWAATGLVMIALILWLLDYCVERRMYVAEMESMYGNGVMGRNQRLREREYKKEVRDERRERHRQETEMHNFRGSPHGTRRGGFVGDVGRSNMTHGAGDMVSEQMHKEMGPYYLVRR